MQPSRYISKEKRYRVLSGQKWRCNSCGCKLKYDEKSPFPGKLAHMDHIWPFSKWKEYHGQDINEITNLQALCDTCNLKKKDKVKK